MSTICFFVGFQTKLINLSRYTGIFFYMAGLYSSIILVSAPQVYLGRETEMQLKKNLDHLEMEWNTYF